MRPPEARREAANWFILSCVRKRPLFKSIHQFIPTESNRILFPSISISVCPSTYEVSFLSWTFSWQKAILTTPGLSVLGTYIHYSCTKYILSTGRSQDCARNWSCNKLWRTLQFRDKGSFLGYQHTVTVCASGRKNKFCCGEEKEGKCEWDIKGQIIAHQVEQGEREGGYSSSQGS